MSLSTKVLLGLGLGIFVGLFFGESASFLAGLGDAFVVLLQMTVLPYVLVALVHSLGALNVADARSLARSAGAFLLLIWALTLAVVMAFPLVFPGWEAASFFSTSMVEPRPPFDPIALYLPANPFQALSQGVVPAVVVFSVAVGLALMVTEQKQALLESLGALEATLQRVAGFVVQLAPYGVFAIAGNAAGTMRGDELLGLQVYAAGYVAAALALSLWILPMLVASLTPFSYGEVLGRARAALITAFATGNVFVVLPILSERGKEMLDEREETRDSQHLVDVIVPIAFTLSSAGKLLALAFPLFAGWLSGFPLALSQMPEFLFTGVFSFFASTTIAIPFLLDLFRVPADTFQLFLVADNVVGNRFGSMLAAVHILCITLLGACGAAGLVRLRLGQIVRWAVIGVLLVLGGLGGLRLAFESVDHPYEGYRKFMDRPLLLSKAGEAQVLDAPGEAPAQLGPALERIRTTGILRVGWARDLLPFVFHNEAGQLVGFDVEMAHALAHDLGVRLELVRIDIHQAREMLDAGLVDVVMTGMAITPDRLTGLGFSDPSIEGTLAFIVRDHRHGEFSSREALLSQPSLRLGIPRVRYYAEKVLQYAPQAELVLLDSVRDFFEERHQDLDGLVFSAEAGSAWTLIHPEFTVAVPHPEPLKVPFGYAVRVEDTALVELLNRWILLKQRDLTIARLFAYWFRGIEPPGAEPPRWSILHDVLGWGSPQQSSKPD